MALRGLAATRAAVGLCRIAASASSSLPSAAAGGRRERELPFALVAERGMVVGGHRGMGMNAVGAPPGAPVGAARERENTLLSFGRAAVAFVEFDVQVRSSVSRLGPCSGLDWSLQSTALRCENGNCGSAVDQKCGRLGPPRSVSQ